MDMRRIAPVLLALLATLAPLSSCASVDERLEQ
jgi:hypothetical protein